MKRKTLALFGGDEPWSPVDWIDSDDRVRGGSSRSYIAATPFEPVARFYGNLDIETLGGAGFASQRTTGEGRSYDLSDYDGIKLEIEKSDDKRYTLILKDALLPTDPESGREQSTISYEYDFSVSSDQVALGATSLDVPWSAFKATYRGKDVDDAPALNVKDVKRLSVMMRSFFGTQQGPFSLSIRSISAYKDGKYSQGALACLLSPKVLMPITLLGGIFVLTKLFISVKQKQGG